MSTRMPRLDSSEGRGGAQVPGRIRERMKCQEKRQGNTKPKWFYFIVAFESRQSWAFVVALVCPFSCTVVTHR